MIYRELEAKINQTYTIKILDYQLTNLNHF